MKYVENNYFMQDYNSKNFIIQKLNFIKGDKNENQQKM